MVKPRIISTGPLLPISQEILGRFGTIEVASQTDEESLISLMDGTIALIVRGVTKISARVIESAPSLRVIGRTGIGYDNIDLEAATSRAIPVVITPGAGTKAVAEGTFAVILALTKRLLQFDQRTRAGDWNCRDTTVIGDLYDATLGIVGMGRIGGEVARIAQAFNMRVLGCDHALSAEMAEEVGVEKVDLELLLSSSDFITLHLPLNDKTRGMFDRQKLSRIKPGAVLLNLARGGLFANLDVLYEVLESGRLSAVGLDVYPTEPPDTSHPIFHHPRLLCTPHVMGLSEKAAHATFSMMASGMAEVLEGRTPENIANPEVFGMQIRTEV